MKKFSVLSWNVQGQRYRGTVLSFDKIAPALASCTSDILCLQEMPDAQGKLALIPSLHSYHLYIPPLNASDDLGIDGYNHNVLLSRYPIINASSFVFPPLAKKSPILENAIRADIFVGDRAVRLYICHFMIGRIGVVGRLKQIEYILADALNYNGPIIICGDMNVAMPKNSLVRKVFKWWHRWPAEEMKSHNIPKDLAEKEIFHQKIRLHGFHETLDITKPTWSPFRSDFWELFQLKLDWFLVKNLQPEEARLGEYLSDHRPINVTCRLYD